MLCPYCQQDVAKFDESTDPTGGRLLTCPKCKEQNVPLLYPVDYDTHPAVPVSIIGLTHHGKTVYISSLIQELERLGVRWPGFHCNWLDETEVRAVRSRMQRIASGSLPDATRSVFPRPQIQRLSSIPRVGGCQLIFYDTGGETFVDTAGIRESGRYVRNSASVVWLISLKDLESPHELSDALTVYIQAMAMMNADVKKQSLIITLTKGDLLLNEPDLPQSAKDFLVSDNLDPRTDSWQRLDKLSKDLESWLLHSGYHNIVNLLKSRFRQVKYCIVSSQGAAATDQQLKMQLMPRGVLAPLFWLWQGQWPQVSVEIEGQASTYLSLEEAIREAPPGATIRLSRGTYNISDRVEFRSPITVIGEGMDATTISIRAERFAMGIRTTGRVSLQNMIIKGEGAEVGDVIRVLEGDVEMVGVRVTGGKAAPNAAEGCGVILAGDVRATFQGCHFVRNTSHGLSVRDRAKAVIVDSRAAHNGRCGFVWVQDSSGSIQNSHASDNRYGIRVQGKGPFRLIGNRATKNKRNGILIEDATNVEVSKNVCEENEGAGLDVIGQSSGVMSENTCQLNRGAGISIAGHSAFTITANHCISNTSSGILLLQKATTTLEKNVCTNNEGSGIAYANLTQGDCKENQCVDNQEDGITVSDTSSIQMSNNVCQTNTRYGIFISQTATLAKSTRNTTSGNKREDVRDMRKRGWFS